jgi:hypothetical protein
MTETVNRRIVATKNPTWRGPWTSGSQMDTARPYVQPVWEYSVVDEPNLRALQQRLLIAGLEEWEAVGLTFAGDARFVVLLKRHSVSTSR